jgi:hypothetical protein
MALFNYEAGGYQRDGSFDLASLATAFDSLRDRPPALLALNEAKYWYRDGQRVAFEAAHLLSLICGRPYSVLLLDTGIGSAVFWDTKRLSPTYWGRGSVWPDKVGLCKFLLRGTTNTPLQVMVDQWRHYSRELRYQRAQQLDYLGRARIPSALLGDLNGTASGDHLPQRDWSQAHPASASHRAVRDTHGNWVDDTRAVDHLIGRWDAGRRVDGAGMHAVAEIDAMWHGADAAQAFLPTVNNNVDAGGGQLIDWMLINDAWISGGGGMVPGSYRVHVPAPGTRPPSDHRMVSADLVVPLLDHGDRP